MIRFITLTILCATLTFAQGVEKRKTVLHDEASTTAQKTLVNAPLKTVFNVSNAAAGDTIAYTQYDYFTNSIIRDQLVVVDGKPYFSPMVRKWGSTRRSVRLLTPDAGVYKEYAIFDTVAANTGWPAIDAQATGTAVGTIGVVCHTPNKLVVGDVTNGFSTPAQFEVTGSYDPSITFAGDTIFMPTSGSRTEFQFWKTPDYGTTFTNFDKISNHSANLFYTANGSVEVGTCKSPNEKYVAFFGMNGNNIHYYNNVDSADIAWYMHSSDKGNTFTDGVVGVDGKIGVVTNKPLYAPLFDSFSQMDMAVGNNGVFHAVANGYSAVFNATLDTVAGAAFPVLYWNSTTQSWKSISSPSLDVNVIYDDTNYTYHTNAIGQAFPSVAVSADGQTIFVCWSGPQVTGGVVDVNATAGVWLYDAYYSVSHDGGNTFSAPAVLAGDKTVSEIYAHSAQALESIGGGNYRAHVLYLADNNAGCAVQAQSAYSANPLVYKTFDITPTTDVRNGNTAKKSFVLEQNYPNPFNPNTNIRFSLSENANVSLKVYDMLGREVSSLISGQEMSAGSHSVNFDASKLTSGVYIYTLKAGSYTDSKKLTLMK